MKNTETWKDKVGEVSQKVEKRKTVWKMRSGRKDLKYLGNQSKKSSIWFWELYKEKIKKTAVASQVIQWLRICLPMEGTWIWSLVQEDLTCHQATRRVCPQLLKPAHSRAHAPQQETRPQWEAYTSWLESIPHSPQLKKALVQQWRPSVQSSHSVVSGSLRPPWTAAHRASLSITNSRSLLMLMSIESVMPSNHLIFCRPPLFLPSIFPSIRVFSGESVLELIKINNFLKRKQLEGYNQRNNLRKFPELVDEFLERRGPVH